MFLKQYRNARKSWLDENRNLTGEAQTGELSQERQPDRWMSTPSIQPWITWPLEAGFNGVSRGLWTINIDALSISIITLWLCLFKPELNNNYYAKHQL